MNLNWKVLLVALLTTLQVHANTNCGPQLTVTDQLAAAISNLEKRLNLAETLGLQFRSSLPVLSRLHWDLVYMQHRIASGESISAEQVASIIKIVDEASTLVTPAHLTKSMKPPEAAPRSREILRGFGEDWELR